MRSCIMFIQHFFLFELLWILIYAAYLDVIWLPQKIFLNIDSVYLLELSSCTSGQNPNDQFKLDRCLLLSCVGQGKWYKLGMASTVSKAQVCYTLSCYSTLKGPKWALSISLSKEGYSSSRHENTFHRTEQKKVCPLDVYKGHGHSAVEAQMPEKPGWNKGWGILGADGESRAMKQWEFGCSCSWFSLFHLPGQPRKNLFLSLGSWALLPC